MNVINTNQAPLPEKELTEAKPNVGVRKQIKIKSQSLDKKIAVIGGIFFGELSDVEMRVLVELMAYEQAQISLSPMMSKSIKTTLNLSDSTFNVSLSRLNKKKAINKVKSLIILSPILNGLSANNEWVIRFESE